MELALLVYAISVADHLRDMIPPALIIAAAIAVCVIIASGERLGGGDDIYSWAKGLLIGLALYVVVVGIFVPTQKTAWMMVGAYAAQKVVESPAMQETSGKVITIINQKLDSFIEETKKEAPQVAK